MIEKAMEKKSLAVQPSDYEKIIASRSTIRKLVVDWQVYDWKSLSSNTCEIAKGKTNALKRDESNYYAYIGEAKSVM